MNFLGIGPLELLFILLIVILVIGPRDIGKTAKSAGRFLNRLYKSDEWRTITEASATLRNLPNRLAREAELEELAEVRQSLDDMKKDLQGIDDELASEAKAIQGVTSEVEGDIQSLEDGMRAWTTPLEPTKKSEETPKAATEPSDNISDDQTEAA